MKTNTNNKHPYLAESELCNLSGLSQSDLNRLKEIKLLVPAYDGKYRPRLVSWARKLVFLIQEGWSFEEMKLWAVNRFSTPNPFEWPPNRADWKLSK